MMLRQAMLTGLEVENASVRKAEAPDHGILPLPNCRSRSASLGYAWKAEKEHQSAYDRNQLLTTAVSHVRALPSLETFRACQSRVEMFTYTDSLSM